MLRYDLCWREQCGKVTGRAKQMVGVDVAIWTILETPLRPGWREDGGAKSRRAKGLSSFTEKKTPRGCLLELNNPTVHTLLQDISSATRTWQIHIYVGGVTRIALRTPSSNKLTDPIKKSRVEQELYLPFMEFSCPRFKANDLIQRKGDEMALSVVLCN